jgi:hypothetical protein
VNLFIVQSISEPLLIGKYFLDLTLVLALSHSEGELFSIAPIVEKVFARPHPIGYNGDFDLHMLKRRVRLKGTSCGR